MPQSIYFRQLLVGRDLARNDPIAVAMRNYIYLIGDSTTNEVIVVDPAYAPEQLVAFVEAEGLHLVGAVATHYHADHVGGTIRGHNVAGLVELLVLVDIPIHVHRDEATWITRATDISMSALVSHDSGDLLTVGDFELALVHTPGHTPGSQCISVNGALLTGDTLFLDGCGRSDQPGGNPGELYESLHHRLAAVPAQTNVFPGHAYSADPYTPIGEIRQSNPVLFNIAKQEWIARYTAT